MKYVTPGVSGGVLCTADGPGSTYISLEGLYIVTLFVSHLLIIVNQLSSPAARNWLCRMEDLSDVRWDCIMDPNKQCNASVRMLCPPLADGEWSPRICQDMFTSAPFISGSWK